MRLFKKKSAHCHHCYLRGYNDSLKHSYGITSFNPDIPPDAYPDNKIIQAWTEFHNRDKPRYVKEIEELLKGV